MCIIDYCTVLVIVMILIMIGDDKGAPSDGQFQERLGYPKMIAALPSSTTSVCATF